MRIVLGILLLAMLITLFQVVAEPIIIEASIYDFEVSILTPFNSFIDEAIVQVKRLDNSTFSTSSDSNGRIYVKDIPKGIVYVKVVSWKGFTINSKWYKASINDNTVIVEEIGLLRVKVIGERGQGLANVNLLVENIPLSSITGKDGVAELVLPEGSYVIKACLGENCKTASVSVEGGKISEFTVQLPVFIEVSPGFSLSFKDTIMLAVIIAIVVIVLYIGLSEYTIWRRKRITATLKPAK